MQDRNRHPRILDVLGGAMLLVFVSISTAAQTFSQWGDLQPGPYAVGFRSILAFDRSRPYNADAYDQTTNLNHSRARPIQINIWFPAQRPRDPIYMRFAEYLLLADIEQPNWINSKEKQERALATALNFYVAAGIDLSRAQAYMRDTATAVVKNGRPHPGPFPLIVYSPSMLARANTNTVLLEFLASHGYVVVSHPSFGVGPGLMDTGSLGIETQIIDMEFVVGFMQRYPSVDHSRLALMGHSWGGMASLALQTRNPEVDAVLSLDGSEEQWRDLLERVPGYETVKVSVPYMRMTTADSADQGLFDSIRSATKYRLKFSGMSHHGFTSNSLIVKQIRGTLQPGSRAAFSSVARYSLYFFECYLKGKHAARQLLQLPYPTDRAVGSEIRIERQEGSGLAFTEAALVKAIIEDGITDAIFRYRDAMKRSQTGLSEDTLLRIGEYFLWRPGDHNSQAVKVFELVLEVNPRSARAYEMLGNCFSGDNDDLARTNYEKALALDPSNLRVRRYLAEIQALKP